MKNAYRERNTRMRRDFEKEMKYHKRIGTRRSEAESIIIKDLMQKYSAWLLTEETIRQICVKSNYGEAIYCIDFREGKDRWKYLRHKDGRLLIFDSMKEATLFTSELSQVYKGWGFKLEKPSAKFLKHEKVAPLLVGVDVHIEYGDLALFESPALSGRMNGLKLIVARERKGFSQEEVAVIVGLSVEEYQQLELGKLKKQTEPVNAILLTLDRVLSGEGGEAA